MLTIRTMTRADLDLAVGWAAAEGWNPGLRDADAFFATDPEGFLIAELDGEPIGCISAVCHGETFGFLGFYIMRPEFRGRGHGIAIWRRAMERFGDRVVGLDGVVAQQDNYRKSGFVLEHRNIRYGAAKPVAPQVVPGLDIVPLAAIPHAELAEYDRPLFPVPRDAYLRAWTTTPGHVGIAVRKAGALAGYGMVRPCHDGAKIGPLFADDPQTARALFAALLRQAPGAVYLDLPAPNADAIAMAEAAGMTPGFETARMYTGQAPKLPLDRIYGVTTFELG